MCEYLEQQMDRLAPTFAFIDPFGWTGMPMQLIARLLNHPSCEVFINLMVGFINRFVTHPWQGGNMNELFDRTLTRSSPIIAGRPRRARPRRLHLAVEHRCGFHVRSMVRDARSNRQYGQRAEVDRREVKPPVQVETASWSTAGALDCWAKELQEWWGRVRGPDGHQVWIRAADLRRAKDGG
jgi:three-Cys-motif partner protein